MRRYIYLVDVSIQIKVSIKGIRLTPDTKPNRGFHHGHRKQCPPELTKITLRGRWSVDEMPSFVGYNDAKFITLIGEYISDNTGRQIYHFDWWIYQ